MSTSAQAQPESGGIDTAVQVRDATAVGTRSMVAGLVGSAMLASVKIAAGVLGNSYALIADGVESVLDVFSSLAVLVALRVSAFPRSERFPYGLGKAEPVGSLVVTTVLLLAAIGIATQAAAEISAPRGAPAPFTLGVLAAVVIVKESFYRWLVSTGDRIGSGAVRSDAWHHRADALTSLAAFVGISIALVAGEGYESADGWAALAACGVILLNALRLGWSALQDILDVQAAPEIERAIRSTAQAVAGVAGIDQCRVRRAGLAYLVDIHVEVDGDISVREGHALAHRVKDALLGSSLPIADALVHIEPAPDAPFS